jgi:twitching motility two-component system response regulator PilG
MLTESQAMNHCSLGKVPLLQLFNHIQSTSYSGGLRISQSNKRYWTLYCQDGRITFATRSEGLKDQMQAQFKKQQVSVNLRSALECHSAYLVPEHAILALFVKHKILNRFQAFETATVLIRTVFADLCALTHAEFFFFPTSNLEPRCASIQPLVLLQESNAGRREWEAMYPYLESRAQILHICLPEALQYSLSAQMASTLLVKLDGSKSIEAVASELCMDVLVLARQLFPLVKCGILRVGQAKAKPSTGALIACIDSNPNVGHSMEALLRRQGLRTLYIRNPLISLNQLFAERPTLIFLDLSMPNVDGYQLCKMFRRSPALQNVPIVVLTDKATLLGRFRAHWVGASAYLSKPLQEHKALAILDRFHLLEPTSKFAPTFSYQG